MVLVARLADGLCNSADHMVHEHEPRHDERGELSGPVGSR